MGYSNNSKSYSVQNTSTQRTMKTKKGRYRHRDTLRLNPPSPEETSTQTIPSSRDMNDHH